MTLRQTLALVVACAGLMSGPGQAWAALPTCDEAATGARLRVAVQVVRAAQGVITFTLYPDDPGRFLAHKGSIGVLRVPAEAPSTEVCIALPGPGVYALAVYHDANGDRRFSRNAIGLPTEAYGLSNDPSTILGLPSFRSVRFTTEAGDNTIQIRLRYPGNDRSNARSTEKQPAH